MQGAKALIKARAEGKIITFKAQEPVHVSKPKRSGTTNQTTDEATCVTQTCTDWYVNGEYQHSSCVYALEPCSAPIGTIPGSGPGTGTTGGGGTTTNSGGIKSGSGIAIFHTAFPSYTAATNHEVQVQCFKYKVQGVTSTLTGFMGGINYMQTGYVVTSIVNNVAYIQISYNIQMQSVVNGNLTVITRQGVVFEVSVNMVTGVGTFLH